MPTVHGTRSDQQLCRWLLDGFPRSETQARALEDAAVVPSVVVLLDVPDDVLLVRA